MKTTAPQPITAVLLALLGAGLAGFTRGQDATSGPVPDLIDVDARAVTGGNSNANGVLEPGETVQVAPFWKNTLTAPLTFTGTASNLIGVTGFPPRTYTINYGSADYGTVAAGATGSCTGAAAGCYLMTISGARPAVHWDARFTENLGANSITQDWTLHVGHSFLDVSPSHPFYRFIETLLHNGVTAGCDLEDYCPDSPVTRAQMAVFLLTSKFGAAHHPPPLPLILPFKDVHAGDFAAEWIVELASLGITGGCGDGNYCPNEPVTRAEMAVFLLASEHGSGWAPPTCSGLFSDVECSPAPAFAVDWVEQLYHEGITGGCATDPLRYCSTEPITRGQMAALLVQTFGLKLSGPSPPPQTVTVTLGASYYQSCQPLSKAYHFSPNPIHIRIGDTINWTWSKGVHSTSSYGGEWDSGTQTGPFTFSHTFTQPGSFSYSCMPGHVLWHYASCFLRCQCVSQLVHEPGVVIVDP